MNKKKKCGHLQDALGLWKKEYEQKTLEKELRLSERTAVPLLMRYSSIQILYGTKKGRVVKCYLCGKIWYTQAEYSKHLSMQR